MLTASPTDLHTARAILDAAVRSVAEARDRIDRIRVRATALADETDWQTPAAREFRERVAVWREELVRLDAEADRVRDQLWWARSAVEALAWSSGS